jgi:CRISPR-associated endonuclease/helicase Cas3
LEPKCAYFAHSTSRPDRADWQPLRVHLQNVADLAREHATKFGAGEWGRVAGLLHDLGKYSNEFQARLEGRSGRVDHSTAGAVEADERWHGLARPLQFAVAGHHAGLANGGEEERSRRSSLHDRLVAATKDYGAYRTEIELPETLARIPIQGQRARAGFQCAFLTRVLFSCLVDADYLDTETFYDRVERRPPRRAATPPLAELKAKLDKYLADLAAKAEDTAVNRERATILAACRAAAPKPPGLFTLTVPTGGGKTLASLAFALDHVLAHRLDRVIYVVPYTSIIEQNAAVFRDALGAKAVLEHHSAFIDDPKAEPEARDKLRQAMENWNAAVVVTTAVQFFESLFADRPSRCRKLHNIARSVVILDEAQTLPLPLLRPCVAALDELARNYGTSVVLCTATQPALNETDDPERSFKGGLRNVREIAPEPKRLYQAFKRVTVERIAEELDDTVLAARLRARDQALCVVNTRAHARELYEQLAGTEGHFHLSALMCPRHRSERLAEIRSRLHPKAPQRCIVVSTSLVEAGVDVDFPIVYRAEAGIDSIAQAAGRCNREGRLDRGEVFVFRPAGRRLLGEQNRRAGAAADVFRCHDDPLALDAVEDFFRNVYWSESEAGLDQKQILARLEERKGDLLFPFEAIARDFKLIEDGMLPILIPFDEAARRLLTELETTERVGAAARRLQPYVVQVHQSQFNQLRGQEIVQPVAPQRFGEQFCALVNESLYRPDVGLTWDDPTHRRAEDNVI